MAAASNVKGFHRAQAGRRPAQAGRRPGAGIAGIAGIEEFRSPRYPAGLGRRSDHW